MVNQFLLPMASQSSAHLNVKALRCAGVQKTNRNDFRAGVLNNLEVESKAPHHVGIIANDCSITEIPTADGINWNGFAAELTVRKTQERFDIQIPDSVLQRVEMVLPSQELGRSGLKPTRWRKEEVSNGLGDEGGRLAPPPSEGFQANGFFMAAGDIETVIGLDGRRSKGSPSRSSWKRERSAADASKRREPFIG